MAFVTVDCFLTLQAPRAGLEDSRALCGRAIARAAEEALSDIVMLGGMAATLSCRLRILSSSVNRATTDRARLGHSSAPIGREEMEDSKRFVHRDRARCLESCRRR